MAEGRLSSVPGCVSQRQILAVLDPEGVLKHVEPQEEPEDVN